MVTIGMIAPFYLSPLEYLYCAFFSFQSIWIEILGFGMVVLGTGLFIWARITLGGRYSGHIHVKNDQELVQTGPYRLIRHPA